MTSRILLLHDADAATGRIDSSDTLLEAQAIAAALDALGYEPAIVPVTLDLGALEQTITAARPLAAFNLVESLAGRGQLIHVVPALLDSLGVPYTGCPTVALGMTSHKLLAKRQMLRAKVPTPAIFAPGGEGPWIVKSLWEHASLGIDDSSIVADAAGVAQVLAARQAQFGGEWFAERFVAGRELNVALLATERGVRPLPVAEIRFDGFPADKPAIVGYAAKWHADSFEYRHTVRTFDVEPALAAALERLAVACWDLFALRGYARVDFRVSAAGAPLVLEINANPCLSPDAGFAAALGAAGIPYRTAIGMLLDDALRARVVS